MTDEEKKKIIAESKKKSTVLSLIGFAQKAGKLVWGTDRICDEIRRHGVPEEEGKGGHGIVVISSDASDNTVKRIKNACGYYNVAYKQTLITSAELGEKTGHGDLAAVAVFDRDFRVGLCSALAETTNKDGMEHGRK